MRDHEHHTWECGLNCPGHTAEAPGGLVKQITRPHPQSLDSVGLCWGPRTCIPNKSPHDTDAAGPQKTQ